MLFSTRLDGRGCSTSWSASWKRSARASGPQRFPFGNCGIQCSSDRNLASHRSNTIQNNSRRSISGTAPVETQGLRMFDVSASNEAHGNRAMVDNSKTVGSMPCTCKYPTCSQNWASHLAMNEAAVWHRSQSRRVVGLTVHYLHNRIDQLPSTPPGADIVTTKELKDLRKLFALVFSPARSPIFQHDTTTSHPSVIF